MIITIYRLDQTQPTLEIEIKRGRGKDFPSNVIKEHYLPLPDKPGQHIVIYVRPYYRKKVNGILNIFCEEETIEDYEQQTT